MQCRDRHEVIGMEIEHEDGTREWVIRSTPCTLQTGHAGDHCGPWGERWQNRADRLFRGQSSGTKRFNMM